MGNRNGARSVVRAETFWVTRETSRESSASRTLVNYVVQPLLFDGTDISGIEFGPDLPNVLPENAGAGAIGVVSGGDFEGTLYAWARPNPETGRLDRTWVWFDAAGPRQPRPEPELRTTDGRTVSLSAVEWIAPGDALTWLPEGYVRLRRVPAGASER